MHRREELLTLECEMSAVHAFLSSIPEDVDYEKLLKQAWDTFQMYPPDVVAKAGQISMSSRYDVRCTYIHIEHLAGFIVYDIPVSKVLQFYGESSK